MDKKDMMALAERIACRHPKWDADKVADRCMAIKHAYGVMVIEPIKQETNAPMVEWFNPDTINCRCFVKPISVGESTVSNVLEPVQPVGTVIPERPAVSSLVWRAVPELNEKQWRDDDAIEISFGINDARWRGTVQEYRADKYPHAYASINKWRFLACASEWLECLSHKTRPSRLNGVLDNTTFIAMYPGDNDNYSHQAQRIADINWTTVLAVKRVL